MNMQAVDLLLLFDLSIFPSPPPPVNEYILLTDGSPYLLTDNTYYLLAGSVEG